MCCDSHTRVRFLSLFSSGLCLCTLSSIVFLKPLPVVSAKDTGAPAACAMEKPRRVCCGRMLRSTWFYMCFSSLRFTALSAWPKKPDTAFFFCFFFVLRPFLNDTELEPCRRSSLYFVQWSFPNVSTFISSPLSSFPVLIKDQSLTPRSTLGVSRGWGQGVGWGGALCGAAGSR